MGIGVWELGLILIIVVLIFGAGKLPSAMKDFGKSIRGFKEGLKGEDEKDNKKDQ